MGRGKSIFAITVHRLLLIIAAGLLVLSYISFLFNPAKAWFMTLFGLAFPLLLILNIFLLLWAILRRSKAFIIPLLALLPTVFIVGRYYRPSHEEVEKTASGGLKVLSYNVGRFSSRGFQSKKACADSVMEYIRRQSPDVICLQEFYMDDADKVKSYLSKKFRGYDIEYFVFPTDNGCYGNVTLSRHSIKNRGHIDFNESANLAIFCDFEVGDVRYRVYNCHLQSYGISLASIAKSIKDSGERKKTESKLRASIRMRPRQVGQIMDNIEECPYPAILVGDFNDTPSSYTYRRLLRGRKDSFIEAGDGFGATYSLFRPFLRIDYIMYPQECEALTHEVDQVRYSDHYPVISKIDFPKR